MSNLYFKTIPYVYHGVPAIKLISVKEGSYGAECIPFRLFIEELVDDGMSSHSVITYGRRAGAFFNFLMVGYDVLGGSSPAEGAILCRSWKSYLTRGGNSASDTVVEIDRILPSPYINESSADLYHVPVQAFIKLIPSFAEDMKIAAALNKESYTLDSRLLVGLKFKKKLRTDRAHDALDESGFRKGRRSKLKKSRIEVFGHINHKSQNSDLIDITKYFPLNKITGVITVATSYRNAALWALIAATSLRGSEATQVLWEDIDLIKREVYAVDPALRPNPQQSYAGLNEVEINSLSWKGRRTKYTLLLEPYGRLFFHYLALYARHEYKADVHHNFVFQTGHGSPLCFSDYGSVILRPFQIASKLVLKSEYPTGKKFGLHSLRHSYCVFFKNFVRHTEGVGLSDHEIMLLTGHATLESVRRYAKIDRSMLEAKLAVSFMDRYEGEEDSYEEHLLSFHQGQIDAIRAKLDSERPEPA